MLNQHKVTICIVLLIRLLLLLILLIQAVQEKFTKNVVGDVELN